MRGIVAPASVGTGARYDRPRWPSRRRPARPPYSLADSVPDARATRRGIFRDGVLTLAFEADGAPALARVWQRRDGRLRPSRIEGERTRGGARAPPLRARGGRRSRGRSAPLPRRPARRARRSALSPGLRPLRVRDRHARAPQGGVRPAHPGEGGTAARGQARSGSRASPTPGCACRPTRATFSRLLAGAARAPRPRRAEGERPRPALAAKPDLERLHGVPTRRGRVAGSSASEASAPGRPG